MRVLFVTPGSWWTNLRLEEAADEPGREERLKKLLNPPLDASDSEVGAGLATCAAGAAVVVMAAGVCGEVMRGGIDGSGAGLGERGEGVYEWEARGAWVATLCLSSTRQGWDKAEVRNGTRQKMARSCLREVDAN